MPIDFSLVGQSLPVLLKGLRITALVSLIGIPQGILIGTIAAYAAQSHTLLRPVALAYVELVRSIPYLILVYLSFFGLPKLGVPATAMSVAIGCTAFYTGGYFCEVLRAALKSAKGPGNFRNLFLHSPGGSKDGIKLIPVREVAAKDEFTGVKGTVVDVKKGATTSHIRVDIGNGQIMTSSITNEAVDELGIKAKGHVTVVVKASDVMIAVD